MEDLFDRLYLTTCAQDESEPSVTPESVVEKYLRDGQVPQVCNVQCAVYSVPTVFPEVLH